MDARDEIKQRLSVEEVVGDYLPLKRAGRNMKGLSPFTSEKTPSLMVSPDKQIWHDFSSGRGGDMFSFVMEMEGADFPGAIEILARKANVDLSQYSRGDGTARKKKDRIIEAHRLAEKYYHATLTKNKKALDYLTKERKFKKAAIAEFKLGFAPSKGDALVGFLKKRGFKASEITDAGLASKSSQPRDMFRSRIMVPMYDGQGQPIGFSGRILGDGQPKYLNTPSTLVYDKSTHIYALAKAKEAIRSEKFVVIVEGQMDVIATHMAGTKNVVAVAGTAMTRRHLVQISRLAKDVRLSFDSDEAGVNATKRAIEIAQEVDVSLSVISLLDGKDPDELVQHNAALWKQAIKKSQYVVDWTLEQLENQYDISTAEGKKDYSNSALKLIATLVDSVERDHYMQAVAGKLSVSVDAMEEKLTKIMNTDATPKWRKKAKTLESNESISSHQDLLLGMMLRYPEIRESLGPVHARHFSSEWRQATATYLENTDRKPVVKTPDELQEHDTYVKIALFRTEELYGPWNSSDRMIEAIGLARRLLNDYQKLQKEELVQAIAEAERVGDDIERVRLLTKFNQLIKGEVNAGNQTKEDS